MRQRQLWIAVGLTLAVVAAWMLGAADSGPRSSTASPAKIRCYDETGARYSVGALIRVAGEVKRCNEDGKFERVK
jgi:hypothetical protein